MKDKHRPDLPTLPFWIHRLGFPELLSTTTGSSPEVIKRNKITIKWNKNRFVP